MKRLALVLLAACATAPEPKPEPEPPPQLHREPRGQVVGPSQGRRECDLARDSHKFNADMRAVPIEKAVAGMADVTCINFKIMPGTTGNVTMIGDPPEKAYPASALLDEFIKAAAAAGITLRIEGDFMVVEQTKK